MAPNSKEQNETTDIWSDWLLNRRYGGGTVLYRGRFLKTVEAMRDRVLDGAQLAPGMSLIDVGAGDGLIAFGAIARIGHSLKVTFVDLSEALLQHAKSLAASNGALSQCKFLQATADNLEGVEDDSADVVTTRSVLAYVTEKPRAFAEFYRVLQPGGRISLAEPINQDIALETCAMGKLLNTEPANPRSESYRLMHRLRSVIFPSTESEIALNPMTNFNERDLVVMARQAGFSEIHLELHIDLRPTSVAVGISSSKRQRTHGQALLARFFNAIFLIPNGKTSRKTFGGRSSSGNP